MNESEKKRIRKKILPKENGSTTVRDADREPDRVNEK